MAEHRVEAVDPFDLPEWLGVEEVLWTAQSSLAEHRVTGWLRPQPARPVGGPSPRDTPAPVSLDCDLLAVDLAYPMPVLGDAWRSATHRAWALGEVLLVEYDGRLTVALPGSTITAEPALEAVRRLARAVGASPASFAVALRL